MRNLERIGPLIRDLGNDSIDSRNRRSLFQSLPGFPPGFVAGGLKRVIQKVGDRARRKLAFAICAALAMPPESFTNSAISSPLPMTLLLIIGHELQLKCV